jgi:phenylalanyl-tRNA synthetase alpha chain
LLGLLREFYRKLGFEKIRFRPSYFPYTEPSLEVEVYFEQKKAWLELGGAGIFRPEVCLPLWGKYPVLAWGLSLERPIMLANDVEDIRSFYKNDMEWLRNFKLKQ